MKMIVKAWNMLEKVISFFSGIFLAMVVFTTAGQVFLRLAFKSTFFIFSLVSLLPLFHNSFIIAPHLNIANYHLKTLV